MIKLIMMRRVWVLAAALLLFALAACGGGDSGKPEPAAPAANTQPDPTATAVIVPSTTPVPTATTKPVPTETVAPTTVPPPVPTEPSPPPPTTTPTTIPTQAPSPTAVPPTKTPAFAGTYLLFVHQQGGQVYSGKTVTFHIGGLQATETSTWQQGGVDEINLTASTTAQEFGSFSNMPVAAHTGPNRGSGVLASPSAQPLPPHVFMGTATVDGKLVPQGTVVTALVDGIAVPDAEAAVEATPASGAAEPVTQALGPLADNLVKVWKFDPATQGWGFYDPRPAFSSYNTVRELVAGQFYYIVTKNGQSASLNGQQRTLFDGWNPMVW